MTDSACQQNCLERMLQVTLDWVYKIIIVSLSFKLTMCMGIRVVMVVNGQ